MADREEIEELISDLDGKIEAMREQMESDNALLEHYNDMLESDDLDR